MCAVSEYVVMCYGKLNAFVLKYCSTHCTVLDMIITMLLPTGLCNWPEFKMVIVLLFVVSCFYLLYQFRGVPFKAATLVKIFQAEKA